MKKLVSFFKYFGMAIGLIFLEQLPTVFLAKNQPFWQSFLIALSLLVVAILTIYVAKRLGFFSKASQVWNSGAYKPIIMGFLIMVPVKMLGGMTLVLEHGANASTLNQSVLEQLSMPPMLLFALSVVVAPIVEEVVFRGFIVKQAFHYSYLGVIVSSVLFGAIHAPTDLGSWILYGGMGLVLALVYQKTKKLEYSIAVHALNNFLGVLSLIL
ncbi:lysostaphin resistance A-like protein [Streptococcus equinus]|uniref:CPBP family intramembrane glutamic endopeptidase n=1 Tax=Streptococcus equinus TaxID=1335 RepID=UPI003BF7A8FA